MDSRITVEVTADNQVDADLAGRLVAASFNSAGFEDVNIASSPTPHIEQEEEVVEAMRGLSPTIFSSEVVIETNVFDANAFGTLAAETGAPEDDGGFPAPNDDDDDGDVVLNSDE